MPALLGATAKSNCTTPVLEAFIVDGTHLKDPFILEFIIFKAQSPTEQLTPVRAFPVAGRQVVNLADCPTGERLGLGHFVADVDADVDLNGVTGRLIIRWFYKLTPTGDEKTIENEFEIVGGTDIGVPFLSYAMVTDLRSEGVTITDLTDARALGVLQDQAKAIELATGRFFTPRRNIIKMDGNNGRALPLGDVLIGLEKLDIIDQNLLGASGGGILLDDVFVYARHLSQGLLEPDDRENPKISFPRTTDIGGFIDPNDVELLFRNRLIFPIGTQNIEITGVWGYTDPNPFKRDDQLGVTPRLIKKACMMLVLREGPLLTDSARDATRKGPIKSERTLQQSVTYGTTGNDNQARGAGLTGDPEIDVILAQYARPTQMAAV